MLQTIPRYVFFFLKNRLRQRSNPDSSNESVLGYRAIPIICFENCCFEYAVEVSK